jgi:hypothetical protein
MIIAHAEVTGGMTFMRLCPKLTGTTYRDSTGLISGERSEHVLSYEGWEHQAKSRSERRLAQRMEKSSSEFSGRLVQRRGDYEFDAPYVPALFLLIGLAMLVIGLLSLLLWQSRIFGSIDLLVGLYLLLSGAVTSTPHATANSRSGLSCSPA